jgi:adenylate kinase
MIAPPGAGKGTQGERIADHYGVRHISTGDLLREQVSKDSDLGRKVKQFVQSGELVPDEVILEIIREAIEEASHTERRGYVLDGIPRTIQQARDLYLLARELDMTANAALHLRVSDAEIVRRLLSRASAQGRADDTEDVIRRRLEIYREVTEPILAWYAERQILVTVDGEGATQKVTRKIFVAFDAMHLEKRDTISLQDPLEMSSLETAFGATTASR